MDCLIPTLKKGSYFIQKFCDCEGTLDNLENATQTSVGGCRPIARLLIWEEIRSAVVRVLCIQRSRLSWRCGLTGWAFNRPLANRIRGNKYEMWSTTENSSCLADLQGPAGQDVQGSAKRWSLGCVNTAGKARGSVTQEQ